MRYTTSHWRRVRAAAVERDDGRCTAVEGYDSVQDEHGEWVEVPVVCGDTEDLHVHHVTRPEDGGDPFDLDNLLTLCPSHHARLHHMSRQREERDMADALADRLRSVIASQETL